VELFRVSANDAKAVAPIERQRAIAAHHIERYGSSHAARAAKEVLDQSATDPDILTPRHDVELM
jgi:hypothetical protein